MRIEGWSVREAATRLLCSEASIRRRIASDGDLEAVPGAKPVRVTVESVASVQDEMLRKMGIAVQPTDASTVTTDDAHIAQLEAEVRLLQGALADLTAANGALLDTYRRLSEGAVPNN